MAQIEHPERRYWRLDKGLGRNIYALISNNQLRPSHDDPLIMTADSSMMAELVVDTHNTLMQKYGPKYHERLDAL